jgi:hypothetical protein
MEYYLPKETGFAQNDTAGIILRERERETKLLHRQWCCCCVHIYLSRYTWSERCYNPQTHKLGSVVLVIIISIPPDQEWTFELKLSQMQAN